MLNVDNTKWEQELDEFGVEGIPHFAFLDKEGEKPQPQYSNAESQKVHQVVDPRSHGSEILYSGFTSMNTVAGFRRFNQCKKG
ncbi:UNVERIFIED_CONTAM: Thioredoxin-like protein, chloroplastic [Sesamum angustifolium]|uniref:Thioredoxin-like protein, chloroplastic n=1 Tax=Sesamum angustifolium TaxID=2727405 RepID=A0AAW2NJL5_9LAMI